MSLALTASANSVKKTCCMQVHVVFLKNDDAATPPHRTSVKLFDLGVRTSGGLFFGAWYAGSIDLRRFRTPSLPIFSEILGLL